MGASSSSSSEAVQQPRISNQPQVQVVNPDPQQNRLESSLDRIRLEPNEHGRLIIELNGKPAVIAATGGAVTLFAVARKNPNLLFRYIGRKAVLASMRKKCILLDVVIEDEETFKKALQEIATGEMKERLNQDHELKKANISFDSLKVLEAELIPIRKNFRELREEAETKMNQLIAEDLPEDQAKDKIVFCDGIESYPNTRFEEIEIQQTLSVSHSLTHTVKVKLIERSSTDVDQSQNGSNTLKENENCADSDRDHTPSIATSSADINDKNLDSTDSRSTVGERYESKGSELSSSAEETTSNSEEKTQAQVTSTISELVGLATNKEQIPVDNTAMPQHSLMPPEGKHFIPQNNLSSPKTKPDSKKGDLYSSKRESISSSELWKKAMEELAEVVGRDEMYAMFRLLSTASSQKTQQFIEDMKADRLSRKEQFHKISNRLETELDDQFTLHLLENYFVEKKLKSYAKIIADLRRDHEFDFR